ncbi:MAG: HAMP domain-containing sensor histidine kinase [Pseudomonadota bacterium]
MLLKKMLKLKGTLAFRLTLWYTGIFSISSLAAFLAFFLLIRSVINEQRDDELLKDLKEFSIMLSTGGVNKIKQAVAWEAGSEGVENVFLRVFSADGEELAGTDMSAWEWVYEESRSLAQLKAGSATHVFETLNAPGQSHQVRVICGYIGNGLMLQFGESLEEDEDFLRIYKNVFTPLMMIVTLMAALTGWMMAKSALAGVEEITHTALEISKGAFDRRVTIKDRGLEIEQLATTFNFMLDRINTLFKEMKETNNNIAHDLRSPLARMRGAAEMALTTVTTMEEYQAIAAGMVEDCDRLMGMINTMLDIAEAESGIVDLKLSEVDIARVIKNACDLFMPVAENNSVKIMTDLADGCFINADPRMLQRMVGNLLDNALKYTPPQGTVTISAAVENGQVILRISDTGIGISEKDLPRIFDKFYRCDASRTLHGSGLGLSLVKAIVTTHGGQIVASSHSGGGSIFAVTLPRSSSG